LSDTRKKTFPRLTGRHASRCLGAIPRDVPAIVVSQGVLNQILEVSDRNLNVEVGGFLLGAWCRDPRDDQDFIEITDYIEAKQVDSTFSSLTFTHDSWSRLHRQLATRFPNHQVVGWHHTHPGFGIFLSRQDEFIHRNFFDQPWQVAMVVDPKRGELGFFQWKDREIVDAGFLVNAK